jgi:myo-inositol-1(or 4)-monophosphatase
MDTEIIKIFNNIFCRARKYLLTKGYEESHIVKENPLGDVSRYFDIKAENILIEGLSKEFPDYGIISEEIGEITHDGANHFFIIDPVDGSYNFLRKIGGAGCSIALLKDSKEDIRNVFIAFVGNYVTGDIFFSQKDCGAYQNSRKIHCSNVTEVFDAVAGIDFDFENPVDRKRIFSLLTCLKRVRYIGSASIDLCNVANSAYDAYIDYRDDLTPENFCAAQLIIKESGGIFTNGCGNEITAFSMDERFSIIGSATLELTRSIVRKLLTKIYRDRGSKRNDE